MVSVSGVFPAARWRLSLTESIPPQHWDSARQTVKRGHPDAMYINQMMNSLRLEITELVRSLISRPEHCTINEMKEALKALLPGALPATAPAPVVPVMPAEGYVSKAVPENNLFHVLDRYLEEVKMKHSVGYTQRMNRIRKVFLHVDPFQKMLVEDVNAKVLKEIHLQQLREAKANNTIHKTIETIKTFLRWCEAEGYDVSRTINAVKVPRYETSSIWLEEEELAKLESYTEYTDSKRRAVDIFLFAVYTGQRYSGVMTFKHADVNKGVWSFTDPKTKRPLNIPLTEKAQAIVDKYCDLGRLPMISNQNLNDHLKAAFKKVGIDTPITVVRYSGSKRIETVMPKYEKVGMHTARHTFVTLSLARGMSPKALSHFTHESHKVMMMYAHISERQAQEEMSAVWGRRE